METLNDTISCIGFTLLLCFTLAFVGMFLCGCWSLLDNASTGWQTFSLLFLGSLFALIGATFLRKIWDSLLSQ